MMPSGDATTAQAFAGSWLNCFSATPYTRGQYLDWIAPLQPADLSGRRVVELGCGNGGLLRFTAEYAESGGVWGVDLGDSVQAAKANLEAAGFPNVTVRQRDLIEFSHEQAGRFDVVLCIGVLHHMKNPRAGFEAVLRAVASGGRFHCWVYGHEGNGLVRWLVEPLRRVACRLPWWLNKWGVAFPLAIPFFAVSHAVGALPRGGWTDRIPLADYFRWIGQREFAFHHHVAFDQLVTPQTRYLKRSEIEEWLAEAGVAVRDTYVLARNGNSWKFGGTKVE